ncbi:hypothetical protein [Paraflavitalea devenefica]|uniref:hypothetical protein n=1 Tax=Paraflavitalea devenefica TaxID=2716334 RepID=UPI0014239BE9|nr:hypothetical protein [Paraflavitalea devenefica]
MAKQVIDKAPFMLRLRRAKRKGLPEKALLTAVQECKNNTYWAKGIMAAGNQLTFYRSVIATNRRIETWNPARMWCLFSRH